jgi:molecular chaperone Hsp33
LEDAWIEALALLKTVEDHELTDPSIGVEQLLFRLFNQRGVRVFESQPVRDKCKCSRQRIEKMLARFDDKERSEMIVDDEIIVTCEFCNSRYHFDPKRWC